jgi:outer membrane protein
MFPVVVCCLALGTAAPGEAIRLSLPEAVSAALQRNLALLAVRDSLVAAEVRAEAARAAFLPQATPRFGRGETETAVGVEVSQRVPWTGATVTASATQFARRGEGLAAPAGPDASTIALTVTQPLLRGAGPTVTRYELDNAERSRAGQQRAFALARQSLVVEVTAAYYAVVKQRLTEAVAEQSLRRSQDLARASAARMEVGLASKLDVLRAELQAAQAETALVAARTAQATALERFRVVLGLDPGAAVEPAASDLPAESPAPGEAVEALIAIAIERRLDLAEARDRVRDAERGLRVARLDLLPQVDLSLRATRIGAGDGFANSFRRLDSRAEVLVTASYPLERSAAAAARQVAQLGVEGSQRSVLELQRRVESEVRDRLRSLEALARNIELQRRSVEVAEQQHRLASLRYERGLASNFDVVDAESNLVAARTTLVALQSDYQVARVELRRVTGELDADATATP